LPFVARSGERTRSDGVRSSNVRIAAAARGFRFADTDTVPFLCECSDDGCQQFVPVALRVYDALLVRREWLLADGHVADTLEPPRAQGRHER
jgi:hypothetical protein